MDLNFPHCILYPLSFFPNNLAYLVLNCQAGSPDLLNNEASAPFRQQYLTETGSFTEEADTTTSLFIIFASALT